MDDQASKRIWKRRQWALVRPRFQLQFAAVLVLLQINVGVLFQGVLYFRIRHAASQAASLREFVQTELWAESLFIMVLSSLVTGIVVFFLGVRYSAQIVGPLDRIRAAMRAMGRGEDPPRMKLRPGDALETFADDINELADNLRRLRGEDPVAPGASTEVSEVSEEEMTPV